MTTGPWRRGGRASALLPLLLLLLACVAGCSIHAVRAQATVYTGTVAGREITNFSFPSFDQKNQFQLDTYLTFTGNSTVSQGALQVTPDSSNNFTTYLVNQTGRIFYSTPFVLWTSNSSSSSSNSNSTSTTTGRHVASFSTVFQINLYRANKTVKGEGLAFVVASGIGDDPPAGSYGGFLGLTNSSTDGLASNGFAAVEFDTVKQSYDPDDNHVGLDVNGVHSNVTYPLASMGIELAPALNDTGASDGSNYVWIDYNGATRQVWVYISPNSTKPATAALNASALDLSAILLGKKGYFGFSASTGVDYQLNCVKMWNMTVEVLHDDGSGSSSSKKLKLGLAIGVPCAAALALGLLAGGLYLLKKKRRKQVGDDPSSVAFHHGAIDLSSLPGVPKEFDYKELRKGTNGFDEKMKLGQGGYGVVYRATVPGDNGQSVEVAVKQFSGANTKGQEDFLAELSIINRLRHRNLVKLVGWCHQDGVLLLVYDYMPHGSLDTHIFGGKDADAAALLDWKQRYAVVSDVASALNYLHHEFDQTVIHRDIKPSNIMLDSSFRARLGDFGLARALESDKTSYTDLIGVPGTLGYIAPECFHTGRATRESDVFGFGAVVLEIVCGRRISACNNPAGSSQLLELVWKLHGAGRVLEAVDPRLAGGFDEEEAQRLLLLGLACSHPNPRQRPKAQAILQNLQTRSVPPLPVPMSKPAFMWPVPLADGEVEEEEETRTFVSRSGVTSSSDVSSSSNYPYTTWSSGYTNTTQTQTFQVSREVQDEAGRDVLTV